MQKRLTAPTVAAYMAALPPAQRKPLARLRQVIRVALPKAEERISYGIPGYYQGGAVVFFAAFSKHLSLFAISAGERKILAKELAGVTVKGSTIQFTPEKPLKPTLVRKLIKLRLLRLAAKAAARKKRKP